MLKKNLQKIKGNHDFIHIKGNHDFYQGKP
jgi:hypothetical protein